MLSRALAPVFASIERLLAAETPVHDIQQSDSLSTSLPLLKKMLHLLEQHDAEALDVAKQLHGKTDINSQHSTLRRVAELVGDFQFDPARELVEQLLNEASESK